MAQSVSNIDRDVEGAEVPTYRPIAYTYNGNGDVVTATVAQPADTEAGTPLITWVRTFTYVGLNLTLDSGWVRQ